MTDEIMNLRALLEKSSDADLLCEMIGFTAQRFMESILDSRNFNDLGAGSLFSPENARAARSMTNATAMQIKCGGIVAARMSANWGKVSG